MKVSLVKRSGVPISVGAGPYCFPLENGRVVHSEQQRSGAKYVGKEDAYNQAYELSCLAWEIQVFDNIEENTRF